MKYLTKVKIIVLALILSVGISIVFAWTDPTEPPFGGNVPAPVNVGATEQTKTGRLNVSDFFWADFVGVNGSAYVDRRLVIKNVGGNAPDTGDIITAVDNAGTADWTPRPTLSCVKRTDTSDGTSASVNCLPGEVLTGGGGSCLAGSLVGSVQPVSPNTWQITCAQTTTVTSIAVCCNLQW